MLMTCTPLPYFHRSGVQACRVMLAVTYTQTKSQFGLRLMVKTKGMQFVSVLASVPRMLSKQASLFLGLLLSPEGLVSRPYTRKAAKGIWW